MAGIFINYRRDDTPGVAGRLCDHLTKSFSRRDLFMDVDAMKPGLDFVKQLDTQVSHCDVLLALIGPHWLAEDEQGRRRLHGDRDHVRIEIASALKRDIPVIPVLIHGADMPAEDELPEDLKSLTRRHALELRHTRFAADADAIVSALKDCLPKHKKKWVWLAAAACIVGAFGLWAALYFWPGPTPPESPATGPSAVAPSAALLNKPAVEDTTSQPASPQAGLDETRRKLQDARRRMEEAKVRVDAAKNSAAPSPAETPPATPEPDANAQLRVEGVSVALGDTRNRVKSVYPSAVTTDFDAQGSKPPYLNAEADGVLFFFSDDETLENIRMDAPFKGSVQGIRIGDSLDHLLRQLGQPYKAPWDFGLNKVYLYKIEGGTTVRYDIDPSNKVKTILHFGAPNKPAPKPTAKVETLSVVPGDPFDRVRAAYPTAGESGKGNLGLPLDGIRFGFTEKDRVLRVIEVTAPFIGSIEGVRIGDSADDVVTRLGSQPFAAAQVANGTGYEYHRDGYTLRYDINKSNKVVAIWQILNRE